MNIFIEDGNCSRLAGFAWVADADNCADWYTKSRPVKDLLELFSQNGADFMILPEEDFHISSVSYHQQCQVAVLNVANVDLIGRTVNLCSSWNRM